jgi:hypothetical protein
MNRQYRVTLGGNLNWDGGAWEEVMELTGIEVQALRCQLKKLARSGDINFFSIRLFKKLVGLDDALQAVANSFSKGTKLPKGFPNVEG